MSHEPPGEGIARACRIVDLFQRKGGNVEDARFVHQDGAVLALLDNHHARAACQNPAGRPVDVPVSGELTGFGVVHHQHVNTLKQLQQHLRCPLDPIIHRIARDQIRVLCLVQDVQLQRRIDVAEEHQLGISKSVGQLRLESSEHSQPGIDRVAILQIVGILAFPTEALSSDALYTGEVHASFGQTVEFFGRKVVPYHTDCLNRVKERGGIPEESS